MIIFNNFKRHIDKNIITQCIEYYEDNDVFLKTDDEYNDYKKRLISKSKISYQDMESFIIQTRKSNFSFFKKYNPLLYKAYHTQCNDRKIDYTTPFKNALCIIPNFQDGSQARKFIDLFKSNLTTKYLIIDLRGSRGGSIKVCADLCNLLLPQCEAFSQRFKNKTVTYTSDENYHKFEKIFIFVDTKTASSSEILAYSLYTNLNNVVLIGENTFGKTCGQNIITNKKYGFMFSVVSFTWEINGFSYGNVKILKPENNDYLNAVRRYIDLTYSITVQKTSTDD